MEASIFRYLAQERTDAIQPITSRRPLLTLEGTTALARLDERLAAAPDVVRAGWISRALIYEAAASLRLDGFHVTASDLLLALNNTLDRTHDQDLGRALHIHAMLHSMCRRNPRNLLSPDRIAALARRRLRGRGERGPLPAWLESRFHNPETMREVLREALNPSFIGRLNGLPALEAAAEIVAHWHSTGAAECIGAAPGRALAMVWVRQAAVTAGYYLLPSVGFLGHASDYRPDVERAWPEQFLKSCSRAADWGFKLHSHLTGTHRRMHAVAQPERATSRMAALIDLLVATPAMSASTAGQAIKISSHSAREMLNVLERRGLIYEITGRNSFRLYAAAPVSHLSSSAS
jgi:hypothetical protein